MEKYFGSILVKFDQQKGENKSVDSILPEEIRKIIEEHQTTFDRTNWIPNQTTLYTLIIIYSLLMIVAFLLNMVIFFTVLISKNLHKPNILLSLNLIIANILTSTICTPFTMNSVIFEFWKFNGLLCKLIPFIQAITVFVISTTITVISIDRYMMITSLKRNNYKLSRPLSNFSKNKLLVNLVIWILAITLSSPVLIYQRLVTVGVKNVYVKKVCIELYPDSIRIVYTCLTFIYAFIIPLLTLSYFHYKIKCYLNANILKFDLSRDRLMTNLTTIKTISNQNQPTFFIDLNKPSSDTCNYYSLIDLHLFNSSDSSPTKSVRDFSPPFDNDAAERSKPVASVRSSRPAKQLNKSRTLSNDFQFNLPVYKIKLDKNSGLNNRKLNKSNTYNTLPNESRFDVKRDCSNYISLNQLYINQLSLNQLASSPTSGNESSGNESSSNPSNLPKSTQIQIANQLVRKKKRPISKKSSKPFDPGYTFIYRSLSDSNLFDTNQPSLHNSFLHVLNQDQLSETNRRTNQLDQVSPAFNNKTTNLDLDYLKLVNFDYNQNAILNLQSATRLANARRSEQLKLASFTRFSCFLNRVKRFHYLNRELQRNQKITLILVLGILIFAISWLPLNIYNLYIDFNYANTTLPTHKIYFIFSICHIIAMSSAISNGILYGLLNTNIQKEIIKLFKSFIHSR